MNEAAKFYNPEQCRNEAEVESKFIVQYLLPSLGYPPESWHQEITFGGVRLDFLAIAGNVLGKSDQLQVIFEAKHPNQNLDRHLRKLRHYLSYLQVNHGVLTNGKDVRVYELVEGELVLRLQVPGRDVPQHLSQLQALVGRREIEMAPPQATEPEPAIAPSDSPLPLVQSLSSNSTESTMKVIAVYHNKGGVGKTTTVINLAAGLCKKGKRVLVIDLDSQANTTFATGLVKFQDESTDNIKNCNIYHVLIERNKFTIPEVVQKSSFTFPAVDVIPSHISLTTKEVELNDSPQVQTRLLSKLNEVRDHYDIVLIDTPPSLNVFAKIALLASDYLLIPSDLRPFANEGLNNVRTFLEGVDEFREMMNRQPIAVLGVLASKVNTADRFIKYTLPKMEKIVEERYQFPLLKTRIYERRDLSAALERVVALGEMDIPDPQSIFDYKPNSVSAEEFEALTKEIMTMTGL
ncbi:AAA family ATPase [Alkalinema pantanalense CENA528]|uniref:ParA family protein n=1 Tax=Alkalinema pantanalense TaxID=1620705 RepID=UPI003D6FD432